jgi:hypothetical protein
MNVLQFRLHDKKMKMVVLIVVVPMMVLMLCVKIGAE